MSQNEQSGQGSFVFTHAAELRNLPKAAVPFETALHGTFAVDQRPGRGELYYGMPGLGLLRVSADLSRQDILSLPPALTSANFHSTRLGELNGEPRLFLAANDAACVVIVTLAGDVDFILPRPAWEEYEKAENVFRPTDTAPVDGRLFVADGYGPSQLISVADLARRTYIGHFGGRTEDVHVHGKFGTAHGLTLAPAGDHLTVADRSNSRLERVGFDGAALESHPLPPASRPCGIDYKHWRGHWYAVVGSLDDPQKGRPAPIYVLDADNYRVISTIRPKEDLGVELADHIHNVVWHEHNGKLFLVVQAWNPGCYFVLAHVDLPTQPASA